MSLPINQVICGDCVEIMKAFPDLSVDLVVTSPPYNLQKEYESRNSEQQYLSFIEEALNQIYRILKLGGRVCWNVPNQIRLNRDGKLWSPMIKTANLFEKTNFKFFDIIIWNQKYSDSATAWGSWKSPSAPFIRHQCESILVFYKIKWKKRGRQSDLGTKEFMQLTKSELWSISPEGKRLHPAPFPEELPRRCIKLFSYIGDVVLDPFVGSGTTLVVAQKLGRKWIGVDIKPEYIEMTKKRLMRECSQRLEKFIEPSVA